MVELDEKLLERALKSVAKTGKYSLGLRETMKSLKGVKLLVYSSSLDKEDVSKIEKACSELSVPTIRYPKTSVSLGRICDRPFKVSVMSVKVPGDVDISPLIDK